MQDRFRVASRRLPLLLLLPLAFTACADRAPVRIRASLPSGVPAEGLEVSALPFDADRLLDSLASVAEAPKPSFPDLEQRLRAYRRPGRPLAEQNLPAAWLAIRDSVARLAREWRREDRRARGSGEPYRRVPP